MSIHGGGRGGGKRRGALRGRTRALLRRRLAGGLLLVAAGGPIALDPIATTGDGSTAIALTNVSPLSLSTAGTSATAPALTKVGVLGPSTTGAGASAVALRLIGVLAPATTGRANLAVVLTELGSLSPVTSGRSTVGASLVAIRVLTPATTGASVTQSTLAGVRTFAISTAGSSATQISIGGGHGLLDIATTGSSDEMVALTNGAVADTSSSVGRGASGSSGARSSPVPPRPREIAAPRVLPFSVATTGMSLLDVQLSTHRGTVASLAANAPEHLTPATPVIADTPASDPFEDWATMLLLLEAE